MEHEATRAEIRANREANQKEHGALISHEHDVDGKVFFRVPVGQEDNASIEEHSAKAITKATYVIRPRWRVLATGAGWQSGGMAVCYSATRSRMNSTAVRST